MTTTGNFHLHFSRSDQTYDFDFLEKQQASSETVRINGKNYAIQGDSSQIEWLKSSIPELNEQSQISMQEMGDRLILLNAENLDIPSSEKAHTLSMGSLGGMAVQRGSQTKSKWCEDEKLIKMNVANTYWKYCVKGKSVQNHNEMFSFLRSVAINVPELPVQSIDQMEKAIINGDKDNFIKLFSELPMGIVMKIDLGENLHAIPVTPPRSAQKQSLTESDLQEIRIYIKESGFSGVVSVSDGEKMETLSSENITNLKTPFSIHSVGKVYTGALVLKMIQQGVIPRGELDKPIKLDTTVWNLLPPPVKDHLKKNGAPTMQQIMLHQGGLGDYLQNYQNALDQVKDNNYPQLERAEDFLQFAEEEIYSSGHYSNLGILLVGLSIQHHYNEKYKTSKSYSEILQEQVIQPAKMETFSEQAPKYAQVNPTDPLSIHISGSPAGGYWCSSEDLTKFGQWISSECKNEEFLELMDLFGGEFYPQYGEIYHEGHIDSSCCSFGVFFKNGITLSILSDRPGQANALERAFRANILLDTKGQAVISNISEMMEEMHVPGVGIALVRNGEIDWCSGFGDVELRNTRLQAASISKTINAVAVLSLVNQGKLSLGTDISTLIPSEMWEKIDPFHLADSEHPVTIKRLLNHTAGITLLPPNKTFEEVQLDPEWKERGFEGYQRPIESLPTTDEIILGKSASSPHVNSGAVQVTKTPGEGGMSYTGGGPMLLQKIVEEITKKPFPQAVQELVFDPLKMRQSTYVSDGFPKSDGHDPDGTTIPGGSFVYPEYAAAGAWTTPEDLAKIVIELQKAHKGESNLTIGQVQAQEMLKEIDGLGVAVPPINGGQYFFHEGANAGFKCVMVGSKDGNGAVIMTNGDRGDELRNALLAEIVSVYQWENGEKLDML